jgi:hypothetical protein
MHVCARDFWRLIELRPEHEPMFVPPREELARLVHARYCERNKGAEYSKPWKELPEEIKDDNRRQVDAYLAHLAAADCSVELNALVETPYQLTSVDVEKMAKSEHERWREEKLSKGWHHGPRDKVRRTHPDIVPWDELPDDAKRKDREAMADIPEMLEQVGLCIVKPGKNHS